MYRTCTKFIFTFSDTMTEQVFLKAEYVTTEVKEECDEENYELFTETLNAKGKKTWKHIFCLIGLIRNFKNM